MHRNTYLLLILLTIFAAIVAGVNIAKPQSGEPNQINLPETAQPTPTPRPTVYNLGSCGISLIVPPNYTTIDGPESTVVLTGPSAGDTIIVTCQKNIPRPPLPAAKIERLVFDIAEPPGASITATLYHDVSSRDATPVDKLIFRNPKNGLDIFVSGTGEGFQSLIRNLSILQ